MPHRTKKSERLYRCKLKLRCAQTASVSAFHDLVEIGTDKGNIEKKLEIKDPNLGPLLENGCNH